MVVVAVGGVGASAYSAAVDTLWWLVLAPLYATAGCIAYLFLED
jgi:hypothetical protein